MVPQITHHPLTRADGSATYSDALCSILAGANGPVEVQRRDEIPDEAAIEVNVRPVSGAGGPRERWIEGVLQSVLRSVLLVHLHPRTLIQITLQITQEPETRFTRGKGDVAVLPSLLNAAFLALVDAGLPLSTSVVAALVVVGEKGVAVRDPGEKDVARCRSVHALAYDMAGALLLDESVGSFGLEKWEEVASLAQSVCLSAIAADTADDVSMADTDGLHSPWLRQTLEEKVKDANAWRQGT